MADRRRSETARRRSDNVDAIRLGRRCWGAVAALAPEKQRAPGGEGSGDIGLASDLLIPAWVIPVTTVEEEATLIVKTNF